MDKYSIVENLGIDTLAERITVEKNDGKETYLLSKMELMDMATTTVAYREYLPLLKLSYENIASYFDMFTSVDHQISATYINLLSEYFPIGNLDNFLQTLRSENQALDHYLIDTWFAQILDGLMFLWNHKIIHRNLKPSSIYLRGEENCSVVVGDMVPPSVAYDIRMRTRLPRRLVMDTSSCNKCHSAISYTAPEIFESGDYTIQSDIYSLGCVLLDMITCDTLTNEETLQLRICARHDASTLSETLQNLEKTHKIIAKLIGEMMVIDPQQRLTEVDLQRNEYVIEIMHNIDSNQIKYPAERDKKWARDGLAKNEKLEYYLEYFKQHRNAESRIEHALQLCNQSKSIDLSALAFVFQKDLVPIIEHFISNGNVVKNTLELLGKILLDDLVITQPIITFVTKMIPIFENDEHLIEKIFDILINIATRNAKLLIKSQMITNLVEIMTKYQNNATIASKCCILIWLTARDSIKNDFRKNQIAIFSNFLNILQTHQDNSDLFTKVCSAFLPFVFEKSTIDYLVKYNLVRYFTIGLQKHSNNRPAVKAALTVLSELFKRDERCVMRFLCSRSSDGNDLIDSIETLNQVFDHFKNRTDIARGIIHLLKSMSIYDDAVDEMISTKIDETLLYQIKRFHSDNEDIARTCEEITIRIRQRS